MFTISLPVIPILMEDEIVHTDERPTCDDPDCPCWHAYLAGMEQAEAACIERGFSERWEQLPEYRQQEWEPEMTVAEYERLMGSYEPSVIRYKHSLYYTTMAEAQAAYERLDDHFCEIIMEMECIPDMDNRQAVVRFVTDRLLRVKDQTTVLQLAGPVLLAFWNEVEGYQP
jgi:hypothetical protein